jgi:hypothetical protein
MEAYFNENDDLIILYNLGYDTGKYSHIHIQVGMVDVRTLRSENKNKISYQRILTEKCGRLFKINRDIIRDFHLSKFDPVTITIRNGIRYVIDGQGRVLAVKYLYSHGKISSPMIPCKILQNVTLEDEAMLFATQNDGQVPLTVQEKTKAKVIGKDQKTIIIKDMLLKNKLDFGFNNGKVYAYKTLDKLFDEVGVKTLDRVLYVISEAWENGQVKNSTSADILKGLSVFYKRFGKQIIDDSFIPRLAKTTPDVIRNDFKNYDTKSDWQHKFLKTLSLIYDANRKTGRLNYK